jgi:hypothetical protein
MAKSKLIEKVVTNQNCIHEEIKFTECLLPLCPESLLSCLFTKNLKKY